MKNPVKIVNFEDTNQLKLRITGSLTVKNLFYIDTKLLAYPKLKGTILHIIYSANSKENHFYFAKLNKGINYFLLDKTNTKKQFKDLGLDKKQMIGLVDNIVGLAIDQIDLDFIVKYHNYYDFNQATTDAQDFEITQKKLTES